LARANRAKEILVQLGIDPSRIATAGHGQEKEIASNDTEEGRAQNRRIELVVLRK
jgi:chemotaxis protein MotB